MILIIIHNNVNFFQKTELKVPKMDFHFDVQNYRFDNTSTDIRYVNKCNEYSFARSKTRADSNKTARYGVGGQCRVGNPTCVL